jgi:Concanavalin A-like lectin/glucanases superfamily
MAASVVNTWQLSSAGSYTYAAEQIGLNPTYQAGAGTGTPAEGNWLFAVVSWSSSQDQAVAFASDDAHNFWQPLGISATGSVRTAVLCVQDARLASVVSISSSAFIRDACYNVIEVSGLQAGFIVDVFAANLTTGTSQTISATLTQADFVLAATTFQSTSGVINVSSTGSPGTVTPMSNTTIQNSVIWEASSTTPWSVTFSSSTSTSAAWGGFIVAVAAAAPLVLNPSPSWPVIQCQAAFGATPGDPSAYWTWTDITSRYLGIKASRGRQFELDQLEAADVTITIDNVDGALNPLNSAGPFYPNVKLITPIRLIATWQGRMYQVFSGHYEYLPQTYDFQRGMVDAESSDAFARLPQVYLQNCVEQEILYDRPWSYWPLSDTQGAPAASNWSGRCADLLNVVPSRYGTTGTAATFGNTPVPLLAGDGSTQSAETVWEQTNIVVASPYGTCLQVIDQAFPSIANGLTVEIWVNLNASASTQGGMLISLEDLMHPGLRQGIQANIISVFVNDPGGTSGSNGIILNWIDSGGTPRNVLAQGADIALNRWAHIVLRVTSTTYNVFFQGVSIASGTWTLWSSTPDLMSVMGQQDKFNQISGSAIITQWPDASYGFVNGAAAHVVVYDRIIDSERILSHYNSGATGFAGETTGPRISRLLSYARWGQPQAVDQGQALMQALNYLGQGGYGSLGTGGSLGIFGAYGSGSNSGTAVDQAVVDAAASENGLIYVDQNGALVFRQRSNVYNGPLRGAFGDAYVPLNQNVDFNGTLAPWAAFPAGATLTLDGSTWLFSGTHSAVLNGNGSTANPQAGSENTIPVTAGTTYTASAWVYSPQGCTAQIGINWWSGGSVIGGIYPAGVVIPPATPMKLTATGPAMAGTQTAQFYLQIDGTPPATTLLYFDRASLSLTGPQVPYEENPVINYDVTYLYNDVTITRNADQVIARIVNAPSQLSYFPRVYTRTIYTQTQNPPLDLTDMANWLSTAYGQPAFRIETMTIDALANADAWELVLSLDVGDLVSFQRSALGQPVIFENFIVISVDPTLTQDVATFAYSMAPVLSPVLTLGDPVYGLLGPNALGW